MLYILLTVGLFCLAWGAKWLVQGASGISEKLNIPSVIIGLTVVSIGTSSPEIVVTALSSFEGQSDIAVGNVIGSNLCNTFLILGLAAFIHPLRIHQQIVNKDLIVMLGASLLVFALALKGEITKLDGYILLGLAVAYFLYLLKRAKKGDVIEEIEAGQIPKSLFWMIAQVVGGLVLLVYGGETVINSAVEVATLWGVSPLVIGMTIVAVGTSLPELATSLMATYKGELDLAVGNVVGSNIFNLLMVLGVGALLAEETIQIAPQALAFDIPTMVYSAILCVPIFFSASIINRIEGATLLLIYGAYLAFTIVQIYRPVPFVLPAAIGFAAFLFVSVLAYKAK